MREPADGSDPRAVLLDVDGTLYRQGPLRLRMLLELAACALAAPAETVKVARVLRAFRDHRERLRVTNVATSSCEEAQYEEPARDAEVEPEVVRRLVSEWMAHRPLRHLRSCRRKGVVSFLKGCRRRGVAVGAYSDYPTQAKIEALGLSAFFDLHLCSTDREINAFKPSPKGILEASRRWGVAPSEVLYVGDRWDVDGEAAKAAGVRFALVGRRGGVDFSQLSRFLGWEEE